MIEKFIRSAKKRSLLVVLLFGVMQLPALAYASATLPSINAPANDNFLPGKFIWYDLASPDTQMQKEFYQSVFGWSFHSPAPTGDLYELIINKGHAIGGIFQFSAPEGEQDAATWIALMSVADPKKSVKTAQQQGGTIELQPVMVEGRGTHALLRDPAGALFGVIHSSSGDPADVEADIGDIMWVDLYVKEVKQLEQFYAALAPFTGMPDKTITKKIARVVLSSQETPRAGIVEVGEEANRSAWVPYVRVEDIEATLKRVVEGGGFTIVKPSEKIMDGNLAVFVDPNGATMGILKWNYVEGDKP